MPAVICTSDRDPDQTCHRLDAIFLVTMAERCPPGGQALVLLGGQPGSRHSPLRGLAGPACVALAQLLVAESSQPGQVDAPCLEGHLVGFKLDLRPPLPVAAGRWFLHQAALLLLPNAEVASRIHSRASIDEVLLRYISSRYSAQ